MRINSASRTFESNVPMAPKAFQISASAKAFSILSDTLYKKKELAVVRELLANAVDAHVAARTTDTPFNVHLPTAFEPWFEIEDFGTGLSDTAIHELYTTYFSSDKTDSNELIGGFGLGSKSPFAYTDQFFVSSRKNGELINYSIFIAETGVPMIAEQSRASTISANGLTVRVPVDTAHIQAFEAAALQICPFIRTLYTINKLETEIAAVYPKPDMEFIEPTTNCRITISRTSTRLNESSLVAVIGIVPYPIDPDVLPELEAYSYTLQYLDATIHFHAPIGLLDVTASREGLSYDKGTQATLTRLVLFALAEYTERYKSNLDALPTMFEAMQFSTRYARTINQLTEIHQKFSPQASAKPDKSLNYWNGVSLAKYPLLPGMTLSQQGRRSYGARKWNETVISATDNYHSGINPNEFTSGTVYWTDAKQFRPWLNDNSISSPIALLHGPKETIETFCADFGLDFSMLLYIPKYSRNRTTAIQARKSGASLGAHKYSIEGHQCTHPKKRIAASLLEVMAAGTAVFIGAELNTPMQALRDNRAEFVHARIPKAHGRVWNALTEAGAYSEDTPTKTLIAAFMDLDDPLLPVRVSLARLNLSHRDTISKTKQLFDELEELGVPNVWDGIDKPDTNYLPTWLADWITSNQIKAADLKAANQSVDQTCTLMQARLEYIQTTYSMIFTADKNKRLVTSDYYITIEKARELAEHYIQTITNQGAKP